MLGEAGTNFSPGARTNERTFWGNPSSIVAGLLLAFGFLVLAMTTDARPAEAAVPVACSAEYPAAYCAARSSWYGRGEHLYITDRRKDGYSAVVLYEVHNKSGTRGWQSRAYDRTGSNGSGTHVNLDLPEDWVIVFRSCVAEGVAIAKVSCGRTKVGYA